VIENRSPTPDDMALAIEHRDVEGDLRSIEYLRRRLPGRLGDELTGWNSVLFALIPFHSGMPKPIVIFR
jgi:hypothetical protein